MLLIPITNARWNGPPGSWFPIVRQNGERSAMLNCPTCGKVASLHHAIAADGAVSPSVVCPHDGCDFHDCIRLEGWPA